jgi:hypothetical protein
MIKKDPHSNIDCEFHSPALHHTFSLHDHDLCGFLLWSHSTAESEISDQQKFVFAKIKQHVRDEKLKSK